MNVTCPNCATVYRVDPAKVPEGGVRARCAVCSAVFGVAREEGRSHPVAAPAAAAATPQAPAPSQIPASAPITPAPQAPPSVTASPLAPPSPMPSPSVSAPSMTPPAPPPTPMSPPLSPPISSPMPTPAATPGSSTTPPFSAPTVPGSSRPMTPGTPVRPAAAAAPATRPGTRPLNPFLSQDPSLKARRLARALISDMVVYHPAKRKEGLKNGTLRELFDDEIKKSWQEYSEQVGQDVADSTPYFREALNEILADGQQMF